MDSVSDLDWNIFGHFNLNTKYLELNNALLKKSVSNKSYRI